MKAKLLIRTGILAGVMLAGLGSRAEETETKTLPEMLVESTRNSIVPPHFAGSATVIREETIRKSGARSVAELLATQGGLQLSSTSGNLSDAQVRLRGFGENSNLRVLIMVDGQPVNRPDMAGISWLEVPLSQVERIEILRGNQTARYGNNAVGGVIHLVTKQGGGKKSGSLEIAGGSDGLMIGRASFRDTLAGNDLSLDLERNFSNGWRQNSASEVESIAVRWKRELSPGVLARLGISYSDEYGEFPGPLGRQSYLINPRQSIYTLFGQGNQYFNEQATLRMESGLILGKGQDWTLELPFSAFRRDQSWNLGPGAHADNLLDTLSLTPVLKRRGQTWAAEVGLSYRHDSLDIGKYAEIQRLNQVGHASLGRDVGGIFSSAEWNPLPNWHLNAALRWERATLDATSRDFLSPTDPALNFSHDNDEDNWAAQFGIRWEPSEDLATWLRYDRIYRLPATDEIASYQGFALNVPFNDRLRAETGHGIELGVEWQPGHWLLGANAFGQWLDGEILYDFVQNLNVNFAQTRRLGMELNAGYQSELWEANLRYTWLTAQFTDGPYAGRDVYLVPAQHLSAVVAYHPRRELTLQAEWQVTSEAYEGNDFLNTREMLPAYQVANLLVRYEPKPGISLYLRVNNLFDEHYATVKYSAVWYPAAGRQVQVGLRREF